MISCFFCKGFIRYTTMGSKRVASLIANKEIFHEAVHDLKSPLTAILGLSEVFLKLLSVNLNDKQKEVITRIVSHSKFALELVEDILDIENIASGKIVVNRVDIGIREFLEDALQTHLIPATEKGIRLDLQIKADRLVPIDTKRMKQVVNNLISNAIKFSKSGTMVIVVASINKDSFSIKVLDQGPGIKEEEIGKLFQPFAQLSNKPTANEKSTGLGLSIVKNMIEVLGGSIKVESVAGAGTAFIVTMPLFIEKGDKQ